VRNLGRQQTPCSLFDIDGLWVKRLPDGRSLPNPVDGAYHFSRSVAGQLKPGGRPEIVLVFGGGTGVLNWYEWVKGVWIAHSIAEVDSAHSLSILDFDGDGNLVKPFNLDTPSLQILLNEAREGSQAKL